MASIRREILTSGAVGGGLGGGARCRRLAQAAGSGLRRRHETGGGRATHYNAALEVLVGAGEATRVVWTVDLLPDDMAPAIAAAMDAGMSVMKKTLDALALRR